MKHVMVLFLLVPLAAAQMTTSGAEDTVLLLEAKAAADTSACTRERLSTEMWPVEEVSVCRRPA